MQTKTEVLNDWEDLIKEYKNSGLSKKAFCDKKGIKGHQLYYFENKFNNKKVVPKESESLVPIKFKPTTARIDHAIEFVLKNGTKCLLPVETPDEQLQRIIKVLSTC